VLKGFHDGAKLTEGKVIQALCNCVISAVDGKDGLEDSSAVELLLELLQLEGVDPTCTNEQVSAIYTFVLAAFPVCKPLLCSSRFLSHDPT
jgi:hypothetical protein